MREKREKLASDLENLASLLARNLRQTASPSQAFTASPAAVDRLASALASRLASPAFRAASPGFRAASPALVSKLASALASRLASPAFRAASPGFHAASPALVSKLASALASRLASPAFRTASPTSINRLASHLARQLVSKAPEIASLKVKTNISDMDKDLTATKIAENVAGAQSKLAASPTYAIDALASSVARYLVSPAITASPHGLHNLASKAASLLSQEFGTTEGKMKFEDLDASEISEKKKTKKQK